MQNCHSCETGLIDNQVAARTAGVDKAVALYIIDKLILFVEPTKTTSEVDIRPSAEVGSEMCRAVKTLLYRWLPAYYELDDIVIVPFMPLTVHGTKLYYLFQSFFKDNSY